MAGSFNGSILHFFGDDFIKVPLGLNALFLFGELRMVSRVALDADAPTLFGHAEDEGPPVLWVQVCIRQHE